MEGDFIPWFPDFTVWKEGFTLWQLFLLVWNFVISKFTQMDQQYSYGDIVTITLKYILNLYVAIVSSDEFT